MKETKYEVKYEAVTGIDFEGLKPKVRVERGELIPARVSAGEIQHLLSAGMIREVPNAKRDSLE